MEGLLNADGVWQTDEAKMEDIVVDYYNNLFTSSNLEEFTELLIAVQPKVSTAMNESLLRLFMENEVRLPLKQMYPLKTLGLDGIPLLFFQHF